MIKAMHQPLALSFLLDEAIGLSGADAFLAALGARLVADGVPLAGGALTQAVPHPIIARRTFLWRAETAAVVEALGLGVALPADSGQGNVGREWLTGLGAGVVREDVVGAATVGGVSDAAVLGWATTRALSAPEAKLLGDVARFAAAPLAVLASRATLSALLETYLGRRSAAQVLAGRLRRESSETIRAVLLYADLRGFTELSEADAPKVVVAALDAWFDRIAGAVHAFGGEVLKFIGDGVLAIFPIGERNAAAACDAALRAVAGARAGMNHLDRQRVSEGLSPLPFGMALHVGDMLWGNIGTADRLDFTAIGRAVNLVSRLEGLCRSLGYPVLLSGAFAAETKLPLVALGEHALRGITAPCAVFTLHE
ncbi:MAG: adenylate/guanylate cyclase domain-containing protein [Mesorhizobium sp.]